MPEDLGDGVVAVASNVAVVVIVRLDGGDRDEWDGEGGAEGAEHDPSSHALIETGADDLRARSR